MFLYNYHLTHFDGIIHTIIHGIGICLALPMCVLAAIAWRKTKIFRMFFSSSAFGILAFAQILYMYLERNIHHTDEFENELFDILIVIMTIFFAIGILYKR